MYCSATCGQIQYRKDNAERCKERDRQYYLNDLERFRAYRQSSKARRSLNDLNRRKTDIDFKIKGNMRTRLNRAIKGNFKAGSAVKDLGCSINKFKKYFEEIFIKIGPHPVTGELMSWDSWGRDTWHIDHIKPLDAFDLTDRKQFLKACNYKNLQPLWASDNLQKSSARVQ